jgi:hypothetical protein
MAHVVAVVVIIVVVTMLAYSQAVYATAYGCYGSPAPKILTGILRSSSRRLSQTAQATHAFCELCVATITTRLRFDVNTH